METQGQDQTGRKPLTGVGKRSDAFWSLIVPSARLVKGKPERTAGAHSAHPQTNHTGEFKGTQPGFRKEKESPRSITRANATDSYPHLGAAPKGKEPMLRGAKGRPNPSSREEPADFNASVAEVLKRTQGQPVRRREEGRQGTTASTQPAHAYIGLAEQLKCTKPVENDECAGDGGLSESQVLAPTPASHKSDEKEESSEEPDDTEGSDSDEDYVEDDDEDDSNEAASDASIPVRQRSQLSYLKPRRANGRARAQSVIANERRPRKKVKYVVEDSDEQEDGEEAADKSVHQNMVHPAKAHAQGQSLSILPALPPLSRKHQPWTKEEDETLFSLRNRGKSWNYIGERVLGRTSTGAQKHWDSMRTQSLKPVETRAEGAKGRRRRQISSVISVMARIPKKRKTWSKEEEGILMSLRTQGKGYKYISRRLPGKKYGACKTHWAHIRYRYPRAVTAPEDLESKGKGELSDLKDSFPSSTSQLDEEVKEAESNSHAAINEREDSESYNNGDTTIDPNLDTSPAKQPYQVSVATHMSVLSANASESPDSKAISTHHHNQQASKPLTIGVDRTPSTDGSAHNDQPDTQPVVTGRDPETQKEWSDWEDLLLVSLRREHRSWEHIADHVPSRNESECEERYKKMRAIYGPRESLTFEGDEEQEIRKE